jgi:hypothetical protein
MQKHHTESVIHAIFEGSVNTESKPSFREKYFWRISI